MWRPFSASYLRMKCCASGRMSSRRSRSGGRLIDDIQAVVEIFAKRAFLDRLFEIDIGGGDDAHIDLAACRVTQRREFALLDDAQQLRLRLGRDVADLIEKDRAAVGDFEQTLSSRQSRR